MVFDLWFDFRVFWLYDGMKTMCSAEIVFQTWIFCWANDMWHNTLEGSGSKLQFPSATLSQGKPRVLYSELYQAGTW